MSTLHRNLTVLAAFALAMFASQAHAVPTQMVHVETPECDPLFIPLNVHEIGDAAFFPPNEALTHHDLGPSLIVPCPSNDNPNFGEALVEITNVSGIVWNEVWYVANKDTTITNYDGEANDISHAPLREAFRIDNRFSDPFGTHHPLVFESATPDGIWQVGESWHFVLQDYSNSLGLPPDALWSIGVGDASMSTAGTPPSSGSIIAIGNIPEPTTCLLLLLGLSATAVRRQRT